MLFFYVLQQIQLYLAVLFIVMNTIYYRTAMMPIVGCDVATSDCFDYEHARNNACNGYNKILFQCFCIIPCCLSIGYGWLAETRPLAIWLHFSCIVTFAVQLILIIAEFGLWAELDKTRDVKYFTEIFNCHFILFLYLVCVLSFFDMPQLQKMRRVY